MSITDPGLRIDCLVIVILFHYFPYYEYWTTGGTPSVQQHVTELNHMGYELWEKEMVKLMSGGKDITGRYNVLDMVSQAYEVDIF